MYFEKFRPVNLGQISQSLRSLDIFITSRYESLRLVTNRSEHSLRMVATKYIIFVHVQVLLILSKVELSVQGWLV